MTEGVKLTPGFKTAPSACSSPDPAPRSATHLSWWVGEAGLLALMGCPLLPCPPHVSWSWDGASYHLPQGNWGTPSILPNDLVSVISRLFGFRVEAGKAC